MHPQGVTEGGDQWRLTQNEACPGRPCHPCLSPANPGFLLVVTPVTPVTRWRTRLLRGVERLRCSRECKVQILKALAHSLARKPQPISKLVSPQFTFGPDSCDATPD